MRLPALALLLPLALTACGGQDAAVATAGQAARGAAQVAAAFYPLEYVVEAVGGDRVEVEGLTPPGAEPHDLELGARQTARLEDADLLVLLSGFQPAVDEAAEQLDDRAFDVTSAVDLKDGYEELEGETHEGEAEGEHEGEAGTDPHVWLDPVLLADVGDAVAERLTELDADGAADYERGAAQLRTTLEGLDEDFQAGLATCERREMVVSHNAFGYLADRYRLQQVGISGLSPEEEPSPARIAEASRYAKAKGVTTIFFETLVSPEVARTVADEVGATTAVLDPLEGQPQGGDYVSGMRANLEALRGALGCT